MRSIYISYLLPMLLQTRPLWGPKMVTLAGTHVNDPHWRIHCDRGFALTKNATFLLYEPWTLLRIVPFRASSVRLDAEHDTNVILRLICRLCISWSCLIQWWLQSYSEYSNPINVKWCRKLRKNPARCKGMKNRPANPQESIFQKYVQNVPDLCM